MTLAELLTRAAKRGAWPVVKIAGKRIRITYSHHGDSSLWHLLSQVDGTYYGCLQQVGDQWQATKTNDPDRAGKAEVLLFPTADQAAAWIVAGTEHGKEVSQ